MACLGIRFAGGYILWFSVFQCFVCGDWPWKYSLLHRSLQNQDGTKMGSNTGPWRNWCLFSQPPQSLQRIELDDKSTDLVSASMCKGFHGGSAGKENSCQIWKGQVTCLFSRRTKNDINIAISQKKMQPVYFLVNRNKEQRVKRSSYLYQRCNEIWKNSEK